MRAASIPNKRRHHPSMDRSDATLPTPTNLSTIRDAEELCANLIRRKAQSDADRLTLKAMLGVSEW